MQKKTRQWHKPSISETKLALPEELTSGFPSHSITISRGDVSNVINISVNINAEKEKALKRMREEDSVSKASQKVDKKVNTEVKKE